MSPLPRIAILTPRLHREDAVGNDTRQMQEVLSEAGYGARIFAEKWDRDLPVEHYSEISKFLINSNDILIYHYSLAWNPIFEIFREVQCKKVIKYHNVTPPHFFKEYHEGIAQACHEGRIRLSELIALGCDYFWADSEFNLQDASGIPHERTAIISPLHHVEKLIEMEPDLKVIKHYTKPGNTRKNILMVGRVVPNKCFDELIDMMALYQQEYGDDARLFLVGRHDPQLKKYFKLIKQKIKEHGLKNSIVITGQVSPEELKAYYLLADIFCCLSRHEGFCVPLIEAMALKIPVIARSAAAIPETADDAALLWESDDLRVFAAATHRVLTDENLVDSLTARAYNRYQEHFSYHAIQEKLLTAVRKVCQGEPLR